MVFMHTKWQYVRWMYAVASWGETRVHHLNDFSALCSHSWSLNIHYTRFSPQEEKNFNAFYTLRMARSDAKYVGVREKRAKAKAEAEEQAAKKAQK